MDTTKTHSLPPFKHLLKSSLSFAKANWRSLVGLFLPIQIALLLITLLFTFKLFDGESAVLMVLSIVTFVVLWAVTILKKLTIFSGGLVLSELEKGERQSALSSYKVFAKRALPIAHVAILAGLAVLAFAVATIILGIIVFALPFVFFGLVARVYPAVLGFIAIQGTMITFCTFFVVSVAIIILNLLFFVGTWFASYALLLEEKRGLDALASSFMYVRARRWAIVWRALVLGIISFIPIFVLLGPIYYQIIANAVGQMAMVYAFGLNPVFPEIPLNLALWRDVLGAVAGLISMPLFVTFNYFLWKDVKATVTQFDEVTYTKTRKWLKVAVWTGAVLVVVLVSISFVSGKFAQNDTDSFLPSTAPTSAMF